MLTSVPEDLTRLGLQMWIGATGATGARSEAGAYATRIYSPSSTISSAHIASSCRTSGRTSRASTDPRVADDLVTTSRTDGKTATALMAIWGGMQLRTLVAVLGLLAACGVSPDPVDHTSNVVQVEPTPFSSQHGLYFKAVDDGSTYMQQLSDQVPIDRPVGIAAEVNRGRGEDGRPTITDYYLVAGDPAIIEHYLASRPALAVPHDRELAFERLDAQRWRTFLLVPEAVLDPVSIAHTEPSTSATGGPSLRSTFHSHPQLT